MTLCSHCGAEFAPGITAACRDCGLAPDTDTPPTLAPPPEDDTGGEELGEDIDEELVFDVSSWPAEQRVGFGGALRGENVPFRWEPGPVLVVREFDEAVVEDLLERAGIEDDEWEESTGEVAGEEADEEAHVAMSELFDAADRLVHNPSSGDIVDEVDGLAATIEESRPPFGIEAEVWERMAALAGAIVTAATESDDDAVADAARALRDYLRTYV